MEWCSNAVLIVEYWRQPVEKFLKKGDTLKGTFRFEKMSGSFKKGETLRFADYTNKALFQYVFVFCQKANNDARK
ncbi:MAG: hypothetical protein IKK90_01725 [Bacteroides sp.]|nr:hypothetical protein [Bacteroides sp.]